MSELSEYLLTERGEQENRFKLIPGEKKSILKERNPGATPRCQLQQIDRSSKVTRKSELAETYVL